MYDIHCHVLHGVDDGARDLGDSMLICRLAQRDGVRTIAATPHYIDGESIVDVSDILQQVNFINNELESINLDINLVPGMEIYLVPNLAELYEHGKIITLNNNGYMLVELPLYESLPAYIESTVFDLQLKGVKVIIAHPERCKSIMKHPNIVYSLIEKGCYMQVNAGSIMGRFGRDVQETANILLEHEMVHLISSDTHSGTGRICSLKESYVAVSKEFGGQMAEDLFVNNAEKVINGLDFDIPEPRRVEHKKRKKKFLFF